MAGSSYVYTLLDQNGLRSDIKDGAKINIQYLPEVVLSRIADFLEPEEVIHGQLARTCKRLYSTLPRFVVMCGNNFFHINGPPVSNWAPERIIDGPPLPAPVKKLSLYVEWRDQGWGNRKGRLAVALVRGQSEEVVALQSTEGLGVPPHRLGKATAEVNEDEVVTQARPGDFYSFLVTPVEEDTILW